MRRASTLIGILEATPLILFVVAYRLIEPELSRDWIVPYAAGSIAAVATMSLVLLRGMQPSPLFVGINVYLLVGLLGIVTGQTWLKEAYGNLKASGILGSIVIAGLIAIPFARGGFIGIDSRDRRLVRSHSLYLLTVAIAAFFLAYWLRAHPAFSESVPFVILFVAYALLRSRATARARAERYC